MPLGDVLDRNAHDRRIVERQRGVLRVFGLEELPSTVTRGTRREDLGGPIEAHPDQARPIFGVFVDDNARAAVRLDVADPPEVMPVLYRLRLAVDRAVKIGVVPREHDRHDMWAGVLVGGRQMRDTSRLEELAGAGVQLLADPRSRGRTSFA